MPPPDNPQHDPAKPTPDAEGLGVTATLLRLLLIEDSPFDASLITRLLAQAGFKVLSTRVENAAELRAALNAREWDMVISDHNLPDFNSTAALRICQEAGLDVPFIIVSGEIGEDVAVESMLAGADDYVLKSNLGRLPPALKRSLHDAATRRERRSAEQALASSEARLRGITRNLPGMVFQLEQSVADCHCRFLYASEGTLALCGETPAALLDSAENFFARIDAEDRTRLDDMLATGARDLSSVSWNGRLQPADGTAAVYVAIASRPRPITTQLMLWEGVMIDITAQKMAEAALAQSRENLRALTLHLETVREEERKSVAREVHDDIGGILTGLKFELNAVRDNCPNEGNSEVHARLDAMSNMVESARVASDRIMLNLRPSILDHGIVAALEWLSLQFSKTYSISCRFKSNQESVALASACCTAMFRICQEALTNVAKHANATRVEIELFAARQSVHLEITDDGCGVTASALKDSERFGIRGMRERAYGMGGWIEVHGSPSSGTTVMLSMPAEGGAS